MFADQAHLEHIRSRLWTGREFGQAAVMVGAGFSLNAQRVPGSQGRFLLWKELGEKLFDESFPIPVNESVAERHKREAQRIQSTAGNGPLRLAHQYDVAFGRHKLHELVLRSLPDRNYTPSQLHTLLLSLPWADVFTTNYDTLIERTRDTLYERQYDLVQTMDDIPGAAKPRIVKLHGSFPSHRPFILTEEDYRIYPRKFPGFVNLVQQSMMENAFCLLGFSGDDPNFLHWSGWVRDTLGSEAPSIYLCGLLDLSSAERHVLHRRNIIPVDLSPLFPRSVYVDSARRHYRALEWLLRSLTNGEPPDPNLWPR